MTILSARFFLECGAYSRRFFSREQTPPARVLHKSRKRCGYAPHSKARCLYVFCCAIILGAVVAAEPKSNASSEIQNVIRAQQDAWNRGDIDAFMNGYWQSDQTVFVSGDEVTRGWQKVLDRYKAKYSDRAQMGTLTFSDLEITPLSNESAIALGSWRLKRANDEPHGRFTLIFRKFPDGWKIIHDHTSAADK